MFKGIVPSVFIASSGNADYPSLVEHRFTIGAATGLKGTAVVIEDEDDCRYACQRIVEYCEQCKVVGFDAEWLPSYSKARNRVALVQIATPQKGDVFLFRLNMLHYVPDCLREILEDRNILKVGVSPSIDRDNIELDYCVSVNAIVDLRLLFNTMKGLASLAQEVLNVELSKGFVTVSNWEQAELSLDQIRYAAADAYVSLELFKKWAGLSLNDSGKPNQLWSNVKSRTAKYTDVPFKKLDQILIFGEAANISAADSSTEAAPVEKKYDSKLNAHDDTFLWNLSKLDAESLVRQGKGEVVSYTIRLFRDPQEPDINAIPIANNLNGSTVSSPSSAGDAAELFAATEALSLSKQQRCVVCGTIKLLKNKHIVPKSYVTHFPPNEAETFTIRNVVLMCSTCDKTSQRYIQQLGDIFQGVFAFLHLGSLHPTHPNAKASVQSRVGCLSEAVLNFLTKSWLMEKVDPIFWGEPLGKIIVELYKKNNIPLAMLQQLWHDEFIYHMEPQFLPED